jgi:hypothetical protein
MSIFKRQNPTEVEPASAKPAPEMAPQGGDQALMPPFAHPAAAARPTSAPGVVPPLAAPMYSMRPPEPPPREERDVVPGVTVEKAVMAREAQQRAQDAVQNRLRVAVQRKRAAPSAVPQQSVRLVPRPARPPVRSSFDAARCAQSGLLNLAWSWQEAGSPIRAIHAYFQLLTRYPGTAAADAAVADLVELSDRLAAKGQFHTALAIYEQLEDLV